MFVIEMIEMLLYWIGEREKIRLLREQGAPPPWTDDPILREWRFCNVRRESDYVTQWVAEHWRNPHREHPDLWMAMTIARFLNWVPTLREVNFPLPYEPDALSTALRNRRSAGKQVWGAAYIVSTAGRSMDKIDYLTGVLTPLWSQRERLRPRASDTLRSFYSRLERCNGLGSFMAGQVVADMKYVPLFGAARDWYTFAASGPGSRRGLNRLLGRPVHTARREDNWCAILHSLSVEIREKLADIGIHNLHAQDLQNCLCELDKYARVKFGEGNPKRRFVPRKLDDDDPPSGDNEQPSGESDPPRWDNDPPQPQLPL
jgi:hypothetical protein